MRFLLFDVKPQVGAMSRYLEIASALRPELDQSGGCEFIDRFHRVPRDADGGWMLSFQYWRDEASMVKWRSNAIHHQAQSAGRYEVFDDYRLRIGEVVSAKAPNMDASDIGSPRLDGSGVLLIESELEAHPLPELLSLTRYESIYRPGRFLHVLECGTVDQGRYAFGEVSRDPNVSYATLGVIDREYSMFERAQAPQVFPEP